MCGIAGIASLSRRPIDPETIKPMCDVIAHRGPDDAGYTYFRLPEVSSGKGGFWVQFTDPAFAHLSEHIAPQGGAYYRDEISKQSFALALGHRRLSIIDLSHYGHQPMASSSHRLWLTYNGEIYNYRELREDLTSRGYVFRTRTDSEVLLHLWEEYGAEGLKRLDGMFAFALYDTRVNELVLVRDRFGVKPLYYAVSGDRFLFGSESKALLASGELKAELHAPALAEYLTFQNLYGRDTLFQAIKILEPGTYITVRPGSGVVSAPRAFVPPPPPIDPALGDEETLSEQVAEAFSLAVKRQLVSDVEVGSYLSGGMDSGSIVAVAGRSIPRLLTFTCGFDLTKVSGLEQGFDERQEAQRLSYLLQTEHYDVVLHAGDMPAVMERLSWHLDDPRVGMCHQNWYVAKLASRFVKVCLAGAGGDELFGGYPWRYRPAFGAKSVEEFDRTYLRSWFRLLGEDELPQLLAPDLRPELGKALDSYARIMASAPEQSSDVPLLENLLQRALYFEYKTFLHGFLVTEDRIAMAHSLETRVPFLDNGLADLAWRIPPRKKVMLSRESSSGVEPLISADGKRVLRQAMETFLPREFTQQKKQGFSPPDENWYRGPSVDYIKTILLDPRTLGRSWLNGRFVEEKLEEHFTGKRNHRLLIWSLLSLEFLQRHYLDTPGPARAPQGIRGGRS